MVYNAFGSTVKQHGCIQSTIVVVWDQSDWSLLRPLTNFLGFQTLGLDTCYCQDWSSLLHLLSSRDQAHTINQPSHVCLTRTRPAWTLPYPPASRKMKHLVVAIYYLIRWMDVDTAEKSTQNLFQNSIICNFGYLLPTVTNNIWAFSLIVRSCKEYD